MSKTNEDGPFVKYPSEDVIQAAQSLIAASSILTACADQYASTGGLSVGALLHAANVVDSVIEKLNMAELAIENTPLPF